MKISHFIILTACASASSAAFADNNAMLPPVLDNSTVCRSAMMTIPTAASTGYTYNPPAVAAPSATYTDPASYQLTTRLNQLQGSLAQIQATVNQQGQAINGLQQSQNAINVNIDKRLNALTARTFGTTTTPIAPVSVSPFNSNPYVATPTLSTPIALGGEKARYTNAYATLRSGNFNQAIAEFQGIIKDYPTGDLADNSQYWLGEAFLVQGNKQSAMQAFDKVVQTYPKSDKVPDSLLKLGFVQLGLNNRIKAKEYLDYVIVAYPGTTAASLAMQKKAQAAL
ncbi:MAG: tol-pal system protein YbgF [Methylococcaceae bacterium]|nr:tol-pal system protein YbgF [Methylococcaceae bacterium]